MFLNEEFIKIYEELSRINETNQILNEGYWEDTEAQVDFSKVKISDLPADQQARLDTKYTKCEHCGKQALGCVGNIEDRENRSVNFSSYTEHLVLFDAFGEHLCYGCLQKANLHDLTYLFDRFISYKKNLDEFRQGNDWVLRYFMPKNAQDNIDLWNKLKAKLRIPQQQKDEIDATAKELSDFISSQEYADYLVRRDNQLQAQQQEAERKAQMRQPKTRVKQDKFVYAVYNTWDYLALVDYNEDFVKNYFRQEAIDLLGAAGDADDKILLLKINIAYIKDKRFLKLIKKNLEADDFPLEYTREEKSLLDEYKSILRGGASYVNILGEFSDIDAMEAANDEGLEFNTQQDWLDYVKDYVENII